MIVAHGNTLRALIKHLGGLSGDQIAGLEIPFGEPIVYRVASAGRPVGMSSELVMEHP